MEEKMVDGEWKDEGGWKEKEDRWEDKGERQKEG